VGDPLSIGALGAVAITEGIKFVYGQAAELLKRRRERQATGVEPTAEIEPAHTEILDGDLQPLRPDYEILDQLHERITALAVELSKYNDGLLEPEPSTAAAVDELRRALEAVYGQRITFKGEHERDATGTIVAGALRIETIAGLAIAADVGEVKGPARIQGSVESDTVESGGTVIGVRVQRLDR